MPEDRVKQKAWFLPPRAVRDRAQGRCECRGECGKGHRTRCEAAEGQSGHRAGFPVMLTAAHTYTGACSVYTDFGGRCPDPAHVIAACSECHLALDLPRHTAATTPTVGALELVMTADGHPDYATTHAVPAPAISGHVHVADNELRPDGSARCMVCGEKFAPDTVPAESSTLALAMIILNRTTALRRLYERVVQLRGVGDWTPEYTAEIDADLALAAVELGDTSEAWS